MGFEKYCLLVAATVLVVAVVNQADANNHHLSEKISKTFPDAKEKFDSKAAVGGDGNIVISMALDAVKEIETFADSHSRAGQLGKTIQVFKEGWGKTVKLIADALDEAFDLFDSLLVKKIDDKTAALNAINNGLNDVRGMIYRSSTPVHSRLGAGKAMANITDKGEFKYAIDKIEETGTALFDDLDAAQFFAIQGMKTDDNEVTKKCLQAAHSAIKSAAETANTNFVAGAKSAFEYLSSSDEETIMKHEPSEKLISDAAKAAAANDSDTVAAMDALNKEFDTAIALGISAPILNKVKEGLVEYIEYSAWSVAICYDAIAQAEILAKTDPQKSISFIENAFQAAKSILIDGSVKAYEALGSAGRASGLIDRFQDAIEIAEVSRVEGTKGFDSAKIVAIRGILTGGKACDNALDAAHKMLEANEAVIFDQLHETRHKTFDSLKPGVVKVEY